MAPGNVVRARGMAKTAGDSGTTREALYKALRPDAQPRFDTIRCAMAELGGKLTAVPA